MHLSQCLDFFHIVFKNWFKVFVKNFYFPITLWVMGGQKGCDQCQVV